MSLIVSTAMFLVLAVGAVVVFFAVCIGLTWLSAAQTEAAIAARWSKEEDEDDTFIENLEG